MDSGLIWAHFGFLGGNKSSKQRQIELKFWSQVVLIVVQMAFKTFWRTRIFTLTGITQTLSFWSNFDPNLPPEDGRNQKQPSDFPNQSKSRPYLHSILNDNYNFLGFFWVQMGSGSKIKRQQLKLAPLFQKPVYLGLVVGETILILAHFKLMLFQH